MMTTFKLKLKTQNCPKSSHICFDFQTEVNVKFADLNLLDSDVDTLTLDINKVLLNTAEEVLGKPQEKIQLCITKEILNLCDKRWELKKYRSDEAWTRYQDTHRDVRKKLQTQRQVKSHCEGHIIR